MGSGGASTGKNSTGLAGPQGDSNSADCFVATACFGQHSEITKELRKWRDKELASNNKASKLFISFYYAFWGKPGGWILRKCPFLKPFARNAIVVFQKYFM